MIGKMIKEGASHRIVIFSITFLFIIVCYRGISWGNEDEIQISSAPLPENRIELSSDITFLRLGIKDSILHALRNNFDIEISKLDIKRSDYDIGIERSVYDPILGLRGNIDRSKTPINSQLVGGFDVPPQIIVFQPFIDRGRTANAVIQSLIPTGATLALEYSVFRNFIDPNRFRFLNPSYTNVLEARVTQPLLKGGGLFYNRSLISIARNNKRISLAQFKSLAMEVSDLVQMAYWNFVKAKEDLKVARKSLERAEDLLRKNRIQVEVGVLAPIEIIVAEAGVAARVEAVITAENAIKNREDELKRIMNLENDAIVSDAVIIPVDKPVFEPKTVELEDAMRVAMERRPELHGLQLEVENAAMRSKRRRNELYPQFDFTGGFRYTGLGDSIGDSNDLLWDFRGEFFGLSLSMPIGNRSARSQYNKSKIEQRQAAMNVKKKELDIVVEVRGAVRDAMTNIERVYATRKSRELAEKRLEVEERKLEVGRSTSLEILRAQEDLATAEGNEVKAIVDYEISMGNLERAKGTIFDAYGIELEEEVA